MSLRKPASFSSRMSERECRTKKGREKRRKRKDSPSPLRSLLSPTTRRIHQHLFIAICVVTSTLYVLSLLAERWLRHCDRLPSHGERRRREVVYGELGHLDVLSLRFAAISSSFLRPSRSGDRPEAEKS